MISPTDKPVDSAMLSNPETEVARAAAEAIARFADGDECFRLTLTKAQGEQMETNVPAQAVYLLASLLKEIGKGNAVTLVPMHTEFSTIQAAELMRVSRPYFVKLLEAGKIPYRLVGAHRRVRYADLLAYMEQEKQARKAALKEMIAEQERLGLYE